MSSRIDRALARARTGCAEQPAAVPAAVNRGAVLVDIRPAAQRAFEANWPVRW